MTTDTHRLERIATALYGVLADDPPPTRAAVEASRDGAPVAPSAFRRAGRRRKALSRDAARARATAALEGAQLLGAAVLLPGDPAFPPHLRDALEPPRILFAQGRLELLERPGVAVVGSRVHSPEGAEACARVVMACVAAGVPVVSGLAKGIDAIAHRETLLLEGDTIGVLGCGLDVVYPPANRKLFDAIRTRGLLLTEYPPSMQPRPHAFIRRNRIIAGLASVTVVVEARGASGALTTAGAALDRGRDVMVVPGPITSESHVGSNRLLRDGAAPFLEARDLWDVLCTPGVAALPRRPLAAMLPEDLSPMEREVAVRLGEGEQGLDELGGMLATLPSDLAGTLLSLELRGMVEVRPGRRFRLAQPWGSA